MSTDIRGCSDDIIAVTAPGFSDELDLGNTQVGVLALSTGHLFRFKYDGVWRFTALHGDALIAACSGDEDDAQYSDVVTVDGNAKWAGVFQGGWRHADKAVAA